MTEIPITYQNLFLVLVPLPVGNFRAENLGEGVSRSTKVGVANHEKLANWKRH